jgi:thiosulfate dehydrogenase [quinone] large subunit
MMSRMSSTLSTASTVSMLSMVHLTRSIGLDAGRWLAVLRIGLGLWWLESWRHKNKKAWFEQGAGIAWAQSVADKHKWGAVRAGFNKVVSPRPKVMAYVVVYAELAIGLGVTLGFLTPIALAGGLVLNIMYFVLMIKDWAEQGQNSMMALISVVCIFARANQCWSIDHALHLLGG